MTTGNGNSPALQISRAVAPPSSRGPAEYKR